jgi:DHA2 family multidrug resistance protein
VVWPRVVTICGLSMVFAPLNVAAVKYPPQHLRGAAVGLFALLRMKRSVAEEGAHLEEE